MCWSLKPAAPGHAGSSSFSLCTLQISSFSEHARQWEKSGKSSLCQWKPWLLAKQTNAWNKFHFMVSLVTNSWLIKYKWKWWAQLPQNNLKEKGCAILLLPFSSFLLAGIQSWRLELGQPCWPMRHPEAWWAHRWGKQGEGASCRSLLPPASDSWTKALSTSFKPLCFRFFLHSQINLILTDLSINHQKKLKWENRIYSLKRVTQTEKISLREQKS